MCMSPVFLFQHFYIINVDYLIWAIYDHKPSWHLCDSLSCQCLVFFTTFAVLRNVADHIGKIISFLNNPYQLPSLSITRIWLIMHVLNYFALKTPRQHNWCSAVLRTIWFIDLSETTIAIDKVFVLCMQELQGFILPIWQYAI